MNENTASEIKQMMGYRDQSQCCKRCAHFSPSTLVSGAPDAHGSQCGLNPAFFLPVDGGGWCNHFEAAS